MPITGAALSAPTGHTVGGIPVAEALMSPERMRAMPKILATLALVSIAVWGPFAAPTLTLPNRAKTLKFAVLGDNGSGDAGQYDLATQMAAVHRLFAFGFVIMVGDNFYGSQTPAELAKKFDSPYKAAARAGVTFHAAIGNHDDPFTVNYPPLNMGGRRYYTYVRQQVRFFVLDTNIMDGRSCAGSSRNCSSRGAVEDRLFPSSALWQRGTTRLGGGHPRAARTAARQVRRRCRLHGTRPRLRAAEAAEGRALLRHWIGWPAAQGRPRTVGDTAAGFDQDQAFMIVEVDGDDLFFQTISRTGATVDSGTIPRAITRPGRCEDAMSKLDVLPASPALVRSGRVKARPRRGLPELWHFASEYLLLLPFGRGGRARVGQHRAGELFPDGVRARLLRDRRRDGPVLRPRHEGSRRSDRARRRAPSLAARGPAAGGVSWADAAAGPGTFRRGAGRSASQSWPRDGRSTFATDLAFGYFVAIVIFGRHPIVPLFLLLALVVQRAGVRGSRAGRDGTAAPASDAGRAHGGRDRERDGPSAGATRGASGRTS